MSQRVDTGANTARRQGSVGAVGIAAVTVLAISLAIVRASELHERIGVRSALYSTIAAALLAGVVIDAIRHRLVDSRTTGHERTPAPDPHWTQLDAALDEIIDPRTAADLARRGELLPELRLAARLGAELMGDSRVLGRS